MHCADDHLRDILPTVAGLGVRGRARFDVEDDQSRPVCEVRVRRVETSHSIHRQSARGEYRLEDFGCIGNFVNHEDAFPAGHGAFLP
jgi:hypothetical protein